MLAVYSHMFLSYSLGWAMMYLTLANLVQRFDFKFLDTDATDFEMIVTSSASALRANACSKHA